MFDINKFIMDTLKGMIGNYPDFQIREYALNWYEKGKLTEDDLAEIDSVIEINKNVDNSIIEESLGNIIETEEVNIDENKY